MDLFLFFISMAFAFAAGGALVWIALRRTSVRDAVPAVDGETTLPPPTVPVTASVDDLIDTIGAILADHFEHRLLGVYAGRAEDEGRLEARWLASGQDGLPDSVPATIVYQLAEPILVDRDELLAGLRPGLPPAALTDGEASELEAEAEQQGDPRFEENPFELNDEALTHSIGKEADRAAAEIDHESLAARLSAVSWQGPFGWRGLIVAQPLGLDANGDLRRAISALPDFGERFGIACEVASLTHELELAREASQAPPVPGRVPEPPPPPEPVEVHESVVEWPVTSAEADERGTEPERDPVAERIAQAEPRVAELLIAARREGAVARACITLLSDGLDGGRCYAVDVEGLHTRPVERERIVDRMPSAIGLDLGMPFIQAIQARSTGTIQAIRLTEDASGEIFPAHILDRLGPASRLVIPVFEKGRIVTVYVVARSIRHHEWTDTEVDFAQRVVARAAMARERLRQFEALAEQAAHAREEHEQTLEALEQLQTIVAALPEGLVGLDAEGKVSFANRAAARLFGTSEFALIGRDASDLASNFGNEADSWKRLLEVDAGERIALELAGESGVEPVDVTVMPGLSSPICARLIVLAPQ